MDDLRRRFATLDAVAAPDQWGEVERRVTAAATDRVGGTVRARGFQSRPLPLLVSLALLLVAVVVAALVAGSQRSRLPAVVPPDDASPAPVATTRIGDIASTGLVIYTVTERWRDLPDCETRPWRCQRSALRIADADGTGARRFDAVHGSVVGWTPDGRGVAYADDSAIFRVVAPDGTELMEIGGFDTLCDPRCTGIESVAISPDGTRVAFAAGRSPESGMTSVIAILDLGTGRVSELASTATRNDGPYCDGAADEGTADPPVWSPDGTRLAFARQVIGPPDPGGVCRSAIFVVNADGNDLRGIVPTELHPLFPQWAPDGSVIAFHTAIHPPTADPDEIATIGDVYVVRPDGNDLRRLTDDGSSSFPSWTRGGRLVVTRWLDTARTRSEPWIMDADGSNAEPLAAGDLASLSAVGCLRCPFPPDPGQQAFWQPS